MDNLLNHMLSVNGHADERAVFYNCIGDVWQKMK